MLDWTEIHKHVSHSEGELIRAIARRTVSAAVDAGLTEDEVPDVLTLSMDLTACHVVEGPLDLTRLLAFPDPDLAHDVFGINRHIDRETGELRDCFWPRCGKAAA